MRFMKKSDVNFVIVSQGDAHKKRDNVKYGRGTAVQPISVVAGGPAVEKRVSGDGVFASNHNLWWDNVKNAKFISGQLRVIGNSAYSIPRTFISNGHVYESEARGLHLSELPRNFMALNREQYVESIGNFINDMAQLRPQMFVETRAAVPGIQAEDSNMLDKLLGVFSNVITVRNRNFFHECYEFLRDLPENREFVFSHRDLHSENIFINPETGKVSIIDFELAGYESKFSLMYTYSNIAKADVWAFVNKLPRRVNNDLQFDFNHDKKSVFYFMRWATDKMVGLLNTPRDGGELTQFTAEFAQQCTEMRQVMGRLLKIERMNTSSLGKNLPVLFENHGK